MKKNTIVKPKGMRSSHDLSCQSITTTDLFKIKPVFSRLVIPNDHFDIKTSQINRVDSLPVSSFVNIQNRLAWFYVKNVQVWKPWDSFITQAPYAFGGSNVVPNDVPYISPIDLFAIFNDSTLQLASAADISSSVQSVDDLTLIYNNGLYDKISANLDANGVPTQAYGYTFSVTGRMVYDILYSLGYRFPEIVFYGTSNSDVSAQTLSYFAVHQSLLPLMSYLSVLVNYFVPVKFRSFAFINSFSYLVNPYSQHLNQWSGALNSDSISFWYNVVGIIKSVFYGSDYFTDSLVSPYEGVTSGVISTPDDPNTYQSFISSGSPSPAQIEINQDNDGYDYVTQYLISALQALTSKQQLAALSRNDVVGRALSMFGYKPEVADMVPLLLSHKNGNIYVSPEVAMADTYDSNSGDGTPLGYKAGRGEGVIEDYHTKFDFDAYGSLLCVSSVSPDIMYVYGLHREMMHTNRKLCFDPAYVNLGPQAIGKLEISMFYEDLSSNQTPQQTFGFQNRYAELGYRRDFMSGDFCMRSRNTGLDSFHFFRKVLPADMINNSRFALARSGAFNHPMGVGQFDRIFFDQSQNNDHIQQWTIFTIKADRDIPYNGEMSVGDDNNGKEQEVGRLSEVMNAN